MRAATLAYRATQLGVVAGPITALFHFVSTQMDALSEAKRVYCLQQRRIATNTDPASATNAGYFTAMHNILNWTREATSGIPLITDADKEAIMTNLKSVSPVGKPEFFVPVYDVRPVESSMATPPPPFPLP
jgi:hypothetical protein